MTLHLSSIEGSNCLGNNPGSFLGRLKDQMFPECGVLHPPKKINVQVNDNEIVVYFFHISHNLT